MPRRTARTMISAAQCRCARTLLRWSVSKLASLASVSERAIDNFELERREANPMTIRAIQRAFEDVGVVFLPQDDVPIALRRIGRKVTTATLQRRSLGYRTLADQCSDQLQQLCCWVCFGCGTLRSRCRRIDVWRTPARYRDQG